jgi:hypothetical protein
MKTFGIYEVVESYSKDGRWLGYICSVTETGRQDGDGKEGWGKLYPKSDGRENYKDQNQSLEKEEGSSEDLEI